MRLLCVLLGLVIAFGTLGCSTLTKSPKQHQNAYRRQIDIEQRELADDIDTFFDTRTFLGSVDLFEGAPVEHVETFRHGETPW